jgi:hypothetical protein
MVIYITIVIYLIIIVIYYTEVPSCYYIIFSLFGFLFLMIVELC